MVVPITLVQELMDHVYLDVLMVNKEQCVILLRIIIGKKNRYE